jgi:hypothetical protein
VQTSTVVKKHRVPTYVVLGVIIALIVVACAITPKLGPGVSIQEPFVEIYPGTNISSADQKALDAVLKQFSKSLYKIRTYDRGKLVKTKGSLEDAHIDQRLLAEVNRVSVTGFTDLTLQIGNGNYPLSPDTAHAYVHPSGIPTPAPAGEWIPTAQLRASERLCSRVAPILQKYSQ